MVASAMTTESTSEPDKAAGARPHPPHESAALVARFGALGDMVMLTPALKVLAGLYGRPTELVTSLPVTGALYRGFDFVGRTYRLRSKRTPYALEPSQWRFVRELRARVRSGHVDSAISFSVVPRVTNLLVRGGLDAQAIVTPTELSRGEREHDVDYGRRLVEELAKRTGKEHRLPKAPWPLPRLHVDDGERSAVRLWLEGLGWSDQPIVLVHTQSRSKRRGRWPMGRWIAWMEAIASRLPEAWILLTGGPAERPAVAEIARAAAHVGARSIAGETGLRQLIALSSLAHSMVSLDTGVAHIAAAVGCPLAVLFGSNHPDCSRPLPLHPAAVQEVTAIPNEAWPATRASWAAEHSVEDIAVEAVIDAWSALPVAR